VWTVVAPGVGHGMAMLLLQMTVQIFLVLEAGPVAGLDGALERAGVRFLMLAALRYAGWHVSCGLKEENCKSKIQGCFYSL
jgi:hypothetical protein